MDIKNTLEVVNAIKILGVSGKKIAKDGISLADLPEALELLKHVDEIVAAVSDADQIGAELKELDQAELIALGGALWTAVKEIKEA